MVSSRARTTLLIAVAAQAAVSIINFGLPAIAVELRQELDIGPAGFGAVYAAVGLGSAVALLPVGMLVDRFGARPILAIGSLITLAGYTVAGLTVDPYVFSAAVFVGGIGTAAVPVAGMSALLREFPPERRGVALGWRQLAVPLGGTIGAVALPVLVHVGGISLALIASAAVTAATALWFAWLLPAAAGESSSLRLEGTLTAPGMPRLLLLAALYAFALSAALTYLPSAARDAGMGKAEASLLFVMLTVSAAASRVFWGRVADREGGTRRMRTLADTGLLSAGAALLMPLALHASLAAAVPVVLLVGFGAFGFNGVLYVAAGELVGPQRAGRAVGIASTMVFGATSLASPAAGLVAQFASYDVMWLVAAASSAAGAAVALRGIGDHRARHARQQALALDPDCH
jgi:MFS family permease